MAELCALVATAMGAKRKDGSPLTADDYLPGERPEREIEHEFQSTEQTIANIKEALAPFRK